jgi:hypothetical protein
MGKPFTCKSDKECGVDVSYDSRLVPVLRPELGPEAAKNGWIF